MRTSGQLLFGVLIILFGVFLLIANFLDVNLWAFCFPAALILIGIWLMTRPRFERTFPNTQVLLIGDYDREGDWQVENREHWAFVGDYDLDMLQASIPTGETHLRFFGFVHEIKIITPSDVGVSTSCTSFVSETSILGEKKESFLTPVENTSPGYATAERKIRVECYGFVTNLKVRTIASPPPA
jgi:predicted membrane protein